MVNIAANYRLWWERSEQQRVEIEAILDRVLGTGAEDGSGAGLVTDVALAIRKSAADALRAAAGSFLHTYPEVRDELMDRAARIESEQS